VAHVTELGSLDEATERAIARCRFDDALEEHFRAHNLRLNLPRAQSATAIYLSLIFVVTAINMLGAMTPISEAVLQPIYLLRIGVAGPALVLILVASYLPALHRFYDPIAGAAVVLTGLSVMGISAVTAAAGDPQFQMGDVLVMVYATLFLGLLYRTVVMVAVALGAASVTIGIVLGIPPPQLTFSAAVLCTTGLMCVLSAGRVERLMRTNFVETRALSDIAERDGLTGLYNRRMFDRLTRELWQRAQQEAEALQILLIDIDNFKAFNDRYGHQAGDNCIRQVANVIAGAATRPLDFGARYGGEEFALVLYGPTGSDPSALAEQIRRSIAELSIPHASSTVTKFLTVSVGSALADAGTRRSLAGLIQSADEALYRAKSLGRNRVLHIDAGSAETSTGAFRVAMK
jgi:diguanylate cyclase (GGDEF)-like protein